MGKCENLEVICCFKISWHPIFFWWELYCENHKRN